MEWYWITLIVIGYIFLMVLTTILLNKFTYRDKDECILVGLLWPFTLCFLVISLPISGFIWLISTIADLWDKWEMKSK